jgi:glucose-6-phosphate 1-dehydrogenase
MQVSWSLITPVLKAWDEDPAFEKTGKLFPYPAASWGPAACEEMLERDAKEWARM